MHMFGIVSLFAAFSAMAHAAAIPLTPTLTQSGCAYLQTIILLTHRYTERIQSMLAEMQGMSKGQMLDNNLVLTVHLCSVLLNLTGTILEITKASDGGAVASIAATRVREITVDESGLASLFSAPKPVQIINLRIAELSKV